MANTDLQTALTSIRKFSTEEEAKLLKDFLDKQAQEMQEEMQDEDLLDLTS